MSYEVWGEPEERDYYTEDEMAELQKEHVTMVADLAMMIRRLAYSLKNSGRNDVLVKQAEELLKSHNLSGNILRKEQI